MRLYVQSNDAFVFLMRLARPIERNVIFQPSIEITGNRIFSNDRFPALLQLLLEIIEFSVYFLLSRSIDRLLDSLPSLVES